MGNTYFFTLPIAPLFLGFVEAGAFAAVLGAGLVEALGEVLAAVFPEDPYEAPVDGFSGDLTAALAIAFAVTFAGALWGSFDGVPDARGTAFPFLSSTIVLPRTSTRVAFTWCATAFGSTSVFCSHFTLIIMRFLSCSTISSIMVSEQPCLPIQTVGLRSCIG